MKQMKKTVVLRARLLGYFGWRLVRVGPDMVAFVVPLWWRRWVAWWERPLPWWFEAAALVLLGCVSPLLWPLLLVAAWALWVRPAWVARARSRRALARRQLVRERCPLSGR